MTARSALKLVPLVSAVVIGLLPAGAGATTVTRSFGNWTATFSGTFDYQWSEPNPEPCYPNGGGAVRARFSGRLGEFEISYLRRGAFSTFGLVNNTTRARGSVTESDNRRINPGPDQYGNPCEPRTIDKSGCGTRAYQDATFDLDSTSSDRRLFGAFALHMTLDLGGALNAFASNPCYTGEGSLEDFGYFAGNSPNDSDAGPANWKYRLGKLVGPRLRVAMFAHRHPFTVTAEDAHRSTFSGPASYTGRRFATVTFVPVHHKATLTEFGPSSVVIGHRGGFTAVLLPPGHPATYTWEMKRSGQSRWTVLGTSSKPIFDYTFRVAGYFRPRVTAYAAGLPAPLVSTGPPLQVRFPTWDEIVASHSVQQLTQAAWLQTLRLATPQSRQEVGYWLSVDTCSLTYGQTRTILGPPVPPHESPEVHLGPRPPDITTNLGPVKGCGTYMVASFHTHTPTTYADSGAPVGPSSADQRLDKRDKVPGLVFDYIANPPGGETIPKGYPKDSPARLYRSGLTRRPTPR